MHILKKGTLLVAPTSREIFKVGSIGHKYRSRTDGNSYQLKLCMWHSEIQEWSLPEYFTTAYSLELPADDTKLHVATDLELAVTAPELLEKSVKGA